MVDETRETLEKIIEYEEREEARLKTDPYFKDYPTPVVWRLLDIPVEWKHVRQLILKGVVERFGKKYYRLKNKKEARKFLEMTSTPEAVTPEKIEIPGDMFDVVEGYDDLKEFLKLSLTSEEPVHCLLVGPPATAKSLVLSEIERCGGKFITAGTATKVGIRDVVYEELPRILIIDEIDKITDQKELSSLLTWMELGRIVITKHGLRDEKRGKGWVFGACNTTRGLPPELLDRFQIFHLRAYSPEEFKKVVTNYLVKRIGVKRELSGHIAERVGAYTISIREAIRISRIAKTREDVDRIVRIVTKYKK